MVDAFREFFERCPDPIFLMDGDSMTEFNPAALAMLGFADETALFEHYGNATLGAVTRLHPSLISPPMQPDGTPSDEKAEQMMAIARQQGSHRFEWDHVDSQGKVFPAEVLLTWLGDAENRFHVIVRDISGQVALNARLKRAERLRMLGTLAGGVAHDFNNLLTVLRWHADALDVDQVDRAVGRHARAISESVDRAAALTSQLLSFSRGEVVLPQATDVGSVVAKIHDLMSVLTGETIDLTVVANDTGHVAYVDPSQVEQILINLVTNARDAMPDGGSITINIEDDIRSIAPANANQPVEVVVMSVTDTGTGMDEDQVTTAFEPFVTSKDPGKGSGLGLAIVQAIAEQNGGWVELSSELTVGTTVRTVLPRLRSSAVPRLDQVDVAPNMGPLGGERVLLVEDHPALQQIVAEMLDQSGYVVVTADDGEEALRIATDDNSFDVIVTDVVMPGISGKELIETLASNATAPLCAVIMSGYSPDPSFVPPDGTTCRILTKPFTPDELNVAVRSVLDDRAAGVVG